MPPSGKKVLIADDEPDVHAFVGAAFEEDGYDILTAADGEAALEMARAERPDLIIPDVQMPKKDGFEVFDGPRKDPAAKSIPVIMLTAVSKRTGIPFGASDMAQYYGSEPEAFIDKPIDPDAVREAVNRLLQSPCPRPR